jgi:hypothetical protein
MAEQATTDRNLHGVLAEFSNPKTLTDAAAEVAQSGYKKFDAYTPFPIHGLEKAMQLKESKLGWIVLFHAAIGFAGALALMIWVMGTEYPMNISGKPFINPPVYVPITFELTVLLSAFGAVFGMFYLNNLPRLNNPLFNSKRFEKVTDDGFFICIESEDSLFAEEKVEQLFKEAGALHIEKIYDEEA